MPLGRASIRSSTALATGLASRVRATLSSRLALNSVRKSSGFLPTAVATAMPRRANSTRRGRSSAGIDIVGSRSSAFAAISSSAPNNRPRSSSKSRHSSVTSTRLVMTGISTVSVRSTRSCVVTAAAMPLMMTGRFTVMTLSSASLYSLRLAKPPPVASTHSASCIGVGKCETFSALNR
ncbi:hypothetical protein D3C78_1413110 [compost metagenome]